jgi:hypothetical protein
MRIYSVSLFTATMLLFLFTASTVKAQKSADTSFKPGGKLWGLAFGDYYYKAHSDSLNRGGGNQYTGIEKGRNAFQFRRIYLGYSYDITPKFSAELLLAAEDNAVTTTGTAGDLLSDNKLAFYIKFANIRWKNIWKGTDLVVGQMATPTYALLSDSYWGYRAVEKSMVDIRRTPSADLGAALQGKFDEQGNYGYNFMIGNGTGARPENDKYKWFYADVYAKLLEQKLVIDLYADYLRLNWAQGFHHSRNMLKGFVAYSTPALTVGTEAFVNYGKNDVVGINTGTADTTSSTAKGISVYVRGRINKDKLGYFARVDNFNPDADYDNAHYMSYKGLSGNYEPNNKEVFITAGLDFTPVKNVHLIPNVWYNHFTAEQVGLTGAADKDYDLVYRLTFYFIFR